MPSTYEPIATQTLGSAASSITFSSIPATYTDLKLVFVGTGSASNVNLTMRFNSDSATNYSQTMIYGDGSSALSSASTNIAHIFLTQAGNLISTQPHMYQVDVFSYTGSTYKTSLLAGSEDNNGSGQVERNVGLWRSTAAITTLTLLSINGNINSGSTATLYGIKNA